MSILSPTSLHTPEVRGLPLTDLIATATFADAVCLLLRGDRPSEQERAMLDAMLVAACDHGSETPSSVAACASVASGNPLHVAVATGVLAMGSRHGCAIEPAMRVFLRTDDPIAIVAEHRAAGQRIPGYGHRIYTIEDPRTVALRARASSLGFVGTFVARAQEIECALEAFAGRRLVLNIDGMLAALACELHIPPESGNALFLTSRVSGLAAQALAKT